MHTVIFSLAFAGCLLVCVSRIWPGLFKSSAGAKYNHIPLDPLETYDLRDQTLEQAQNIGPGPRLSRLLLVISICALTVRVEFFRRILKTTECTISSVEVGFNCADCVKILTFTRFSCPLLLLFTMPYDFNDRLRRRTIQLESCTRMGIRQHNNFYSCRVGDICHQHAP